MRPFPPRLSVCVAVLLIALGSARTVAHAQGAWVGGQGSLDASLDYNLGISDTVVIKGDEDLTPAGTTSHQLTLGAEYVPIEKLAVDLSLPLLFIKYTGDPRGVHPGGGSYDDGDLHATLTDLRASARYQILAEPVALSPHLGFSIPVADYETVGNAVAGRHLKALHLGLSVGTLFLGSAYVHLFYEFSLVEKYDRTDVTAQYGQNRSDFGGTLGYKLLDQRLDVHVAANARITHGGVSFPEIDFASTNDVALYHDPILREKIYLAGGGASYQLTDSVGVSADARFFVDGNNTQNGNVFALGVTWTPL